MLDADKTRMIGLPYGEKNHDKKTVFVHYRNVTDGQTDGQTNRIAIIMNIARQCADVVVVVSGMQL